MQSENNKGWIKKSTFYLNLDYNVDYGCHTILSYMKNKGILEEYLISLVQNDLMASQSPFKDLEKCGIFVQRELGLLIDETAWKKIEEKVLSVSELEKFLKKREERLILLNAEKDFSFLTSKAEEQIDEEHINNNPDVSEEDKTTTRKVSASQEKNNLTNVSEQSLEKIGSMFGGKVVVKKV